LINDAEGSGETMAVAVDAKNIVVTIPANERAQHNNFIDRVLRLPVPSVPNEARVQINEKTGTIIITGDVEILPVVISHKGLTITTVTPPPTPTARTPVITERQAIAIDSTAQGGAKLQELVDALDLIKVSAEDRITIVKELHKTGKLRAKLVVE
jgi:flagellar P-ring protein FlgI